MDRGVWTAKTVKRPRQQPAHPQYANYWAPLTRKRHTMPHSAQPQHTNYWAPRTRKRHQEHRPQRPTESSDPTQHAEGRTGDCPGPRKGTTTRRNVTQGVAPPPPQDHDDSIQNRNPCSVTLPAQPLRSVWPNECPASLRLSCLHPRCCMQAVRIWQWLPLYLHTQQQSPGLWPSLKCTYQHQHAVQSQSTPRLLQWKC